MKKAEIASLDIKASAIALYSSLKNAAAWTGNYSRAVVWIAKYLEHAVAAEREACAQAIEAELEWTSPYSGGRDILRRAAAVIRARSDRPKRSKSKKRKTR